MEALLLRLATQLPAPARNLATEARLRLLAQFTKFGTVGTFGFVVDTGVVYALRGSIGLYWAGLVSYFIAASFTWACQPAVDVSRHRLRPGAPAMGAVPRCQHAGLLAQPRHIHAADHLRGRSARASRCLQRRPATLAGMFVNFSMSRMVVFR